MRSDADEHGCFNAAAAAESDDSNTDESPADILGTCSAAGQSARDSSSNVSLESVEKAKTSADC